MLPFFMFITAKERSPSLSMDLVSSICVLTGQYVGCRLKHYSRAVLTLGTTMLIIGIKLIAWTGPLEEPPFHVVLLEVGVPASVSQRTWCLSQVPLSQVLLALGEMPTTWLLGGGYVDISMFGAHQTRYAVFQSFKQSFNLKSEVWGKEIVPTSSDTETTVS